MAFSVAVSMTMGCEMMVTLRGMTCTVVPAAGYPSWPLLVPHVKSPSAVKTAVWVRDAAAPRTTSFLRAPTTRRGRNWMGSSALTLEGRDAGLGEGASRV